VDTAPESAYLFDVKLTHETHARTVFLVWTGSMDETCMCFVGPNRFECSGWGWTFLVLVVVGGGGYMGVRYHRNKKALGVSGRAALPHRAQIDELQSLVSPPVDWKHSSGIQTGGGRCVLRRHLVDRTVCRRLF
jgi:hypothetical protein